MCHLLSCPRRKEESVVNDSGGRVVAIAGADYRGHIAARLVQVGPLYVLRCPPYQVLAWNTSNIVSCSRKTTMKSQQLVCYQ